MIFACVVNAWFLDVLFVVFFFYFYLSYTFGWSPSVFLGKKMLTESIELQICRTLTAQEFIANARQSSGEKQMNIVTCKKEESIKEIIFKLDAEKRQRIYVVDEQGNLDGLITLRDIIAKLVYEPPGYFGDFFNGVFPLPQNSRV